jgi:hypothetical protein
MNFSTKSGLQTPSLTRRIAAMGLLAAAGPAIAKAAPCETASVLFVCPAGTVKSAIARETLKRRAAQLGMPVRVTSRGIKPEDHVTPALAASLRADGINPRRERVRAFAAGDAAAANVVIAFDEAAQAPGLQGARVWIIPSFNSDYPGAKAALAGQVDGLLSELGSAPCAPALKGPR